MCEALGEAALRILLLACVMHLALWLLRIRQAQLRLAGWTVVLAASLAMPILQQVIPHQTAVVLDIPVPALLDIAQSQIPVLDQQITASALPETAGPLLATWPLLEAAYLLVGGTLLLRLTIGIVLSLRLLRRASPIRAEWAAGTRVRISPHVTAPVTVFNVILLPADIARWPSAMREAVIAHERAHVAHWHYAMLLVSQLNRVVFWFSPFSWWLHRRITHLVELVSDDHALKVTGDRAGYAEVLLEMGRRSGPLLRGLAMARPAMLLSRIERVLRDGEMAKSVGWSQCSILSIGAVGLTFAAASLQPSSSPAVKPGSRAQALEASAQPDTNRSFITHATDDARGLATLAEPKAEHISEAPSQSTSAPPLTVPATPKPLPTTRGGSSRSQRRLVVKETFPVPPVRQASWITNEARVAAVSHTASGQSNAGHAMLPAAFEQSGQKATNESRLSKLIDQQTCSGAYLPGPSGVFPGAWLTMINAKFFRNSDGTTWMTFDVTGRTPVDLPVKVVGGSVEFIGLQATTFTVLPKGANHLTGTTQRPYGTIDLACGGSNSHLFDGAG